MNQGILKGIRIIDFTWVLAGPYATRILADFGAEVIKVQTRKVSPIDDSNLSPYFQAWNRNKRSITLDLEHGEARAILLKLIQSSDVVIENFAPRVMSNWKLSFEELQKVKPDLIMVRLSGLGQTGPWKDFVAMAPTIHALSGLTYLTSFSPDSPLGVGFAYADVIAGLYAAFALLAALEERDKTGEGQCIDLSELEALCSVLGPAYLACQVQGKEMEAPGNRPDTLPAAPYGCYPCAGKDQWCVIAVFEESEWQDLGKILGHPPWMQEKKFSTLEDRRKNIAELDQHLKQWTIQHPKEEIVSLLQEAGIPAGPVQNAEELAQDPQLKARQFFIPLAHPLLGRMMADRPPWKSEEKLESEWKPGPLLGEDNSYVFREILGLEESEFASLVQRGIIG